MPCCYVFNNYQPPFTVQMLNNWPEMVITAIEMVRHQPGLEVEL